MTCAWKELISILPPSLKNEIDRRKKDMLLEIRLRINSPPELIFPGESHWLSETMGRKELEYVINCACNYSPWCAGTLSQGFLTATGGHRIGICGHAVYKNGIMEGIREIRSLSIRVARDLPGVASKALPLKVSTLIIGAPGWGKTTLLRDLIRSVSQKEIVAVVDERKELFPDVFSQGLRLDILSGCEKATGIEMLVRTMGPQWIAVDEITAEKDCNALVHTANCGVSLLATAHASSVDEFTKRSIYQILIKEKIFKTFVVLKEDKSYTVERILL